MPKLIIQIKDGIVANLVSDEPIKATIIDYDSREKGRWDAEIDKEFVEKNFHKRPDSKRNLIKVCLTKFKLEV